MKLRFVPMLVVLAAGCKSPAQPSATPAQASPSAFLTDTKSWVMTSSAATHSYQISVALPNGYSKEHPAYPVLYAADANAEFGTVVETARLLGLTKSIPDLVIVGIGYPNPGQGFKASNAPRTRDLTPTADPVWLKGFAKICQERGDPVPEATGGAPEFLNFIRNQLVPSIEQNYNVSHQDRAWFGHSFGGLFGTYALFSSEGLFQRFVIGSPALWWNNRAIFSEEEAFAASKRVLPARVFFSAGLLEQPPPYPMVADLHAFIEKVERRSYKGLELHAHFFDDEDHLSVIPATISKGLRFIYSTAAPDIAVPSSDERLKR